MTTYEVQFRVKYTLGSFPWASWRSGIKSLLEARKIQSRVHVIDPRPYTTTRIVRYKITTKIIE